MMQHVFSFHEILNKTKVYCCYFVVIASLLLIAGCEILPNSSQNSAQFNHYYLWIKSLNDEEVLQEISKQRANKKAGLTNADLHLIMLYSLPNSPVHNPYTAKSQLNDFQLEPYEETTFSTTDLAFIVMLKDQLNQQLLILEQLNNYKGAYKQSKNLIGTQKKQLLEAKNEITQLKKTIIQLKKIEQAISEHGT